jgi:hypothetical protein
MTVMPTTRDFTEVDSSVPRAAGRGNWEILQ